jgi:hypothetical protein
MVIARKEIFSVVTRLSSTSDLKTEKRIVVGERKLKEVFSSSFPYPSKPELFLLLLKSQEVTKKFP